MPEELVNPPTDPDQAASGSPKPETDTPLDALPQGSNQAPATVPTSTVDVSAPEAPAPAENPVHAKPINGTPVVVEHDIEVGDTVLFSMDAMRTESVNRIFLRNSIRGIGNPEGGAHQVGQLVPMIVTRVNGDGTLNGQILLDGNCSLWGFAIPEGDGPGTWQ